MSEEAEPQIPTKLFHATPDYRWRSIQQQGIVPSNESHPHRAPGIYLSHQVGVAEHYAQMNFGEDGQRSWAILEVDGSALAPGLLRADDGHETQAATNDIMEHGYTREQVRSGDFPWWVSLAETGQAVYEGPIPTSAVRLIREVHPAVHQRAIISKNSPPKSLAP